MGNVGSQNQLEMERPDGPVRLWRPPATGLCPENTSRGRDLLSAARVLLRNERCSCRQLPSSV